MKELQPVSSRASVADVEYRSRPSVIAATVLHTGQGVAILDPGPSASLATLLDKLAKAGISLSDIRAVLLTHIHLDHAGATGTLVRKNPAIRVVVHQRGAPHLADPTKLLKSAARLYGDDLHSLWGEVLPVPESNLQVVAGGERLALGELALEVAYTPGHASHHVSYFDPKDGIAYVGDAAGIRISGRPFIFAPTPPPDIDLELWEETLRKLGAWNASMFVLTHFGPSTDTEEHLELFRERLHSWSAEVKRSLAEAGSDAEKAARFAKGVLDELRGAAAAVEIERYSVSAAPELCWYGLARYWRKKEAA
ncbi:MAG: MBL fold metallo-hydrolase [Gemmatimonadales bacterium]|nr:Metallo-beta-lactamase L1 type 3 [bacterium HR33]GIW51156.1 MAG: MBL fold metallo-hydrolase [Gemmatimonadales bacterium]